MSPLALTFACCRYGVGWPRPGDRVRRDRAVGRVDMRCYSLFLGELAAALLLYALRHRLEVLPLSVVLILLLLALPGLLLWRSRPAGA